jgi:hydrogenase-4 component F
MSFFKEYESFFLLSLIFIPFISGIASFFIKQNKIRRVMLISVSLIHFILSIHFISSDSNSIKILSGLSYRDGLSDIFARISLFTSSFLFLLVSFYLIKYFDMEYQAKRTDEEGFILSDEPEAVFTGFLLLFLSAMTMVHFSAHMGLLWASIEATTLFSAPLIYFHRTKKSLEATWKYLIICSVGIALALIGTFFFSLGVEDGDLYFNLFSKSGNELWFKLGFIFIFIGYATKAGIAPMHTWLVDAHSEAPSAISALLSGALLNCAMLGIARASDFLPPYIREQFIPSIFILFGFFSILISSVFIFNSKEYKRALAYSSIENMGIILIFLGLSYLGYNDINDNLSAALFITVLGHSMVKSGIFLLAGLILVYYKTKKIDEVSFMAKNTPYTSLLWFLGFILLLGVPPSPLFLSKYFLFKYVYLSKNWWLFYSLIILFIMILIGFSKMIIKMVYSGGEKIEIKEDKEMLIPSALLFASSFVFFSLFLFWLLKGEGL